MGKNSRQKAELEYSPQKQANAYLSVFQESIELIQDTNDKTNMTAINDHINILKHSKSLR
jgi:hypothetical protein